MSIDHKKIHAAASASFCVRTCLAPALLCCGLIALLPAQAHEQDGGRRDDQRNEQRSSQSGQAQRQQDIRAEQQRQLEQRSFEVRAEEQRRIMRENSRAAEMNGRTMDLTGRTLELNGARQGTSQAAGRGGRMTAEERRDLRRQINEAGQDVYALPPRR